MAQCYRAVLNGSAVQVPAFGESVTGNAYRCFLLSILKRSGNYCYFVSGGITPGNNLWIAAGETVSCRVAALQEELREGVADGVYF